MPNIYLSLRDKIMLTRRKTELKLFMFAGIKLPSSDF